MLIDDVKITIKAGNGGNGASTFRRNAQTPRGGPDGGNGGNGGNVYVVGTSDITALSQFQFKKEIKAEDGIAGKKNNLFGRNGEHATIKVPFGTQITNEETQEALEINKETPVLLAHGGHGGLGNNALKSATNQAPKKGEPGTPGEVKKLHLVMRLIADIGLIGLPNAGKSSLLSVLTNAHPKIANYPFTTLEPNLGVMNGKVIADIPGLIEGASKGKGLGDKFLRHVEKTKFLVHCIDASSEDIERDYHIIREELLNYNSDLSEKEELVVLTKTDLVSPEELASKLKKCKQLSNVVLSVSIYDEASIESFKKELLKSA